MSEDNKDKDFDFIKEHIVVKKKKKYKKWMIPFLMTIIMAILFGIIAAVTFCISEPQFYKLLHKEEETITPVSFPSDEQEEDTIVDSEGNNDNPDDTGSETQSGNHDNDTVEDEPDSVVVDPEPVIVEKTIAADVEDFTKMYDEIKSVCYDANKSLVKVNSIKNDTVWFDDPIETTVVSSGLVIANNTKNLLILVSLDRIKDASSIKIEFAKDITVDAVVHDYDSDTNLAVLAVSLADIPEIFLQSITVATLGESYSISVGNPVIALGSPNGYPQSMEIGWITSKGSTISIIDNKLDLFNTNLEDNENGDGVIVNLKGEVIGLITRTLKENLNENISTVIGISRMKQIIAQMANQSPRIYFGVKAEDMTQTALLSNDALNGIYVTKVEEKSPAYIAGIMSGDIIMKVNDQLIATTSNFNAVILKFKPKDEITVTIKRTTASGKEMDLNITLSKRGK